MLSNGSLTLVRYEIGLPPHSWCFAAVRPPEVEKKNVVATAPPEASTFPDVASTAALEDAASPLWPP